MTDIGALRERKHDIERHIEALAAPRGHIRVRGERSGVDLLLKDRVPGCLGFAMSIGFALIAVMTDDTYLRIVTVLSLVATLSIWFLWGRKVQASRFAYGKKRSVLRDELDDVNREMDEYDARQERVALAALRADLRDMYGVSVAADSLASGNTYLAQTPRGVEHLQLVTYGGSFRLMRGNQEVERIA